MSFVPHNKTETIRITKTFTFEMAHALYNYDGPCRNIHGHSYKLAVTLSGRVFNEPGHPKDGMVGDFTDLKFLVKQTVVDPFDHALVLNSNSHLEFNNQLKSYYEKIIQVPFQPTCENLLIEFKNRISEKIKKEQTLVSIKLNETETSFAEWHLTDNMN